jgi:hypothetical protein
MFLNVVESWTRSNLFPYLRLQSEPSHFEGHNQGKRSVFIGVGPFDSGGSQGFGYCQEHAQ